MVEYLAASRAAMMAVLLAVPQPRLKMRQEALEAGICAERHIAESSSRPCLLDTLCE